MLGWKGFKRERGEEISDSLYQLFSVKIDFQSQTRSSLDPENIVHLAGQLFSTAESA